MKTSDSPIVVEQVFDVSIPMVWHAITDLSQMRQWYFEDIPSFKAEVGFKTQFNVVSQGRNFLHLWEIMEVISFKKLVYNWRYKDYEGNSYVKFELLPYNKGCLLKLTHQITEDFISDIEEFSKTSCYNGWTYFINHRLKAFLDT